MRAIFLQVESPHTIYGMARNWLRMLGIWASFKAVQIAWFFYRRLHTVSLFNIGFARVISNKQNGDDQEENGHS